MKEPQEKRPKSWRREREEWHKPENKSDVNAEEENGRPGVAVDVPEQEDAAEQQSVSDVEGAGDEDKLREERERLEKEEKVRSTVARKTTVNHTLHFWFFLMKENICVCLF